jgi:hypothetical protein
MREFLRRLTSYRKLFAAFVVGSLVPFLKDYFFSEAFSAFWEAVGGPRMLTELGAWMSANPMLSLVGGVALFLVAAGLLSERHVRLAMATAATQLAAPEPSGLGLVGVERLRDLIRFGTDTLLYADLGSRQTTWSPASWHDRTEQWKDHVFEALSECGATDEQVAYIQDLGPFKARKFAGINDDHARLRERLAERIDRLRELERGWRAPAATAQTNASKRPSASVWCACEDQSAYLCVRNDGDMGVFYATLGVVGGPTFGLDGSEFVAWTHAIETKTVIPKGVTFKAKLATLEWTGAHGFAQWKFLGRNATGAIVNARAMYSSCATSVPITRAPTLTVSGIVMAEPDLDSGPVSYRIALTAFGCMDHDAAHD